MIKKIRILIFIAVCSALLPACAHFSSSSFQEEYVQGDQTTFNTGDSVFLKINSYANWSDYSTVNTLVADALQESFSKKGIKAKFLSEKDELPQSYLEIVSIVDNTAGDESRDFDPLSYLSAVWCGLSVFVLPMISTDFDVLVKINRFENGQIVSSHLYSSHMYQMAGFSMIPFMSSDDVGDDIAS
ncbi:hypothetical protein, partial [Oleiphilus sp. HI0061]